MRGVTLIEAVPFTSIALGLIVGGIVFFQQASLSSVGNVTSNANFCGGSIEQMDVWFTVALR